MSRKHLAMFGVLGMLLMFLSVFGCQSYQEPKYQSPTGEATEEASEDEELDIDVSDLSDEEETEEVYEEEVYEEETEYVKPVVQPAATVKTTTPSYNEVEIEEETSSEFTKSPYRPVGSEVEEALPTLTVTEGDKVVLNVKATDADGDKLTYVFGKPLNSQGEWQTRSGDSGVYYPTVSVSDGKTSVDNKVKIVVEPKNNKPVLQFMPNVDVSEGETVVLSPRATDADGDRLTYSYSGWMTSNTKEVGYNEEGTHVVTVSVTDGISTVSQQVTVNVHDVNRAPEVEIEF